MLTRHLPDWTRRANHWRLARTYRGAAYVHAAGCEPDLAGLDLAAGGVATEDGLAKLRTRSLLAVIARGNRHSALRSSSKQAWRIQATMPPNYRFAIDARSIRDHRYLRQNGSRGEA